MKISSHPTASARARPRWIARPSVAMLTAAALQMGAHAASVPERQPLQIDAAPAEAAQDDAAQTDVEYAILDKQAAARDCRHQPAQAGAGRGG